MEPHRGHPPLPAFEQAALNEYLASRDASRGLPGQQLQGLNYSSIPGVTAQAGQGGLGCGYLGLDPILPSVGVCAPLPYQPYAPYDTSAAERQLADLFPNHLDLLNVPGISQMDPYHAAFQEDPLFGPSVEDGQEGEEKPRSKMQEKNRRVSTTSYVCIVRKDCIHEELTAAHPTERVFGARSDGADPCGAVC